MFKPVCRISVPAREPRIPSASVAPSLSTLANVPMLVAGLEAGGQKNFAVSIFPNLAEQSVHPG